MIIMQMQKIRRKIQAWTSGDERAFGRLGLFFLFLISKIYGFILYLRSILYDLHVFKVKKLPCPVISVGNLSLGGTGKTPFTMHLAEMIQGFGYRVSVISRGYKGRAEKKGGMVSDGRRLLMDVKTAGDEPYLMAERLKGIPVLVGADRFKMGRKAVCAFSSNVILLDDGFQHRRLARDLDLVLIDDRFFLGDQRLLPRGMLREPVSGLGRADAFVLTHSSLKASKNLETLKRMFPEKPVFQTCHVPYLYGVFKDGKAIQPKTEEHHPSEDMGFLKNARVFVFSGIAGNRGFVQMVERMVKQVVGVKAFADHHRYSERELADIRDSAEKSAADFLVTTHKDYVRIAHRLKSSLETVVVGAGISFLNPEDRFCRFIREKIISALKEGS